jgi:ribosomal protein L40E
MASIAGRHREQWMWAVRNGVAVLAALVLASVLSGVQVFREAALGSGGFNAAEAVRILGYGIALAVIWISAWRAAAQIRAGDPVSRLLHESLPPFATLLILPGVYGLIHPFLSGRAVTAVSWMFVLLLLATAVWLGLVLYGNAEALVIGAAAIRRRLSESAERRAQACQKCGAANSSTAKFCASCGTSLAQPSGRDDRVTIVSDKERSSTELKRSA